MIPLNVCELASEPSQKAGSARLATAEGAGDLRSPYISANTSFSPATSEKSRIWSRAFL